MPSILRTSYCKFYGAHFAPCTTNHPYGFNLLITRALFNVKTVSRSSSKLVLPFFWYSLISSSFHHKKNYVVIIFSSFHFHHTLFSWAFVNPRILFSKSQSVYTFVCLITQSFLIRLQPNLSQHFSYVWFTSKITFSLEQAPDCIWEILLHCMLIVSITWTPC